MHWIHFLTFVSKSNVSSKLFQFPILKEEQNASGRDGDHALFVCRRPENQAADGGEQRLCLPSPPSPVFVYHGGRNGAATPTVTLTVSVKHVLLSPTNSASEHRTTRSPHCTKQEGSLVSLRGWWNVARSESLPVTDCQQIKVLIRVKNVLFKESLRHWQSLQCLFCCRFCMTASLLWNSARLIDICCT